MMKREQYLALMANDIDRLVKQASDTNPNYVYDVGEETAEGTPDPTVQPHIHVTTAPVRHSSDSTKDDDEVGEICVGYTTYDPTSGSALALSR
ncbi:hypothetical protein P5673_015563 [Acropora cervicornis]|uniref:Uncharacterized protein n=1 Tax=Acropora cervicornis TaxID=6130 RepID=A0AAD9QI39_ACRCE|nr:hypothetical protein P5673_015563 [Acropora cervicornis]